MIQATENIGLNNPRLERAFTRLGERIGDLDAHRDYGSLLEKISGYAKGLNTELTYNPSRSRYLDLHIRRNELAEPNMTPASSAEENLEASSFKLFQDLFSYLDELIQIRKDMVPTKGPKPAGTNRLLLDQKRPEFDTAISSLASAIGILLESLSNQSRDFVEGYIKDHTKLVHQFMNAPLPKSHIKFRHLLGLDKNEDGSKRVRTQRTSHQNTKHTQPKTPIVLAEHLEGDTYRITLPGLNQTILAKKTSRIFHDGSARFRPLDPNLRASISRLKQGQDWVAAYVKK